MAAGRVRSRARGKAGFNVGFHTNQDLKYTVKEIYDKFEEDLPKYFMVSTGSNSEALECKLLPGQVIRFHCTAMKERVAGRVVRDDGQQHLFSFHTEADIPDFQVLQQDKTVIPFSSCRIYHAYKDQPLPVTIQLTRKLDERYHVGQFQLTHTFPEMHLLGNLIINDMFEEDVVYFPVFLEDLRLVEITGIRDQPHWEWQAYQIDHQRESCAVEYDTHYSSLRVAIYKSPANDQPMLPVSGNTEAVRYTTMSKFLDDIICHASESKQKTANKPNAPNTRSETLSKSNSMAARFPNVESELTRLRAERQRKLSLGSSDPLPAKENLSRRNLKGVDQTYCKLDISVKSANRESDVYEEIEVMSMNKSSDDLVVKESTSSESAKDKNKGMKMPPLPKRPKEKLVENKNTEDKTKYTNMIPRGEAKPMAIQAIAGVSEQEVAESKQDNALYVDMQKLPTVGTAKDVENLTMDELGEFLKILKLGHAVDSFKERMVDGAILVELDKDMLESEFGLSKLEVIRLLKFAKTGHVPV